MTDPATLTAFCGHCGTVLNVLKSPPPHMIEVSVCPCKCHWWGRINRDNKQASTGRTKRLRGARR